jgi:hypothetical protein
MKIIPTLVTSLSLVAAFAALAPHTAHAEDKRPTKKTAKNDDADKKSAKSDDADKKTARSDDSEKKIAKNDGAEKKVAKNDDADKNPVDVDIDKELYKNDPPKSSDDSKSSAEATDSSKVDADKGEPKVKEKPSLGPQGALYTAASVSANPYVLFGYFPVKDFTIAAGMGMSINGNGGATSPLTELKGNANANVGADVVLAAMYFVVDKHPFAMGPEVVVVGSVAPGSPFDTTIVEPMWGLRYAPWAAPIAIGTDVGVSIAMVHGAKPVAGLTTSGLDIVFAF